MATKEPSEKPKTRTVILLGEKVQVRVVEPSAEAVKALGPRSKKEFIGHLAINPPDIERRVSKQKTKILRDMALMSPREREEFIEKGPIDFVPDKSGYKKYEIVCATCGDKVAYLWGRNDRLDNWCDLHYISWYTKTNWRGSLAVNVSPIDGRLGFECCCGEDTRDHRCSAGLPPLVKKLMIDYSMKHRDFATPDSKFIALAVS